MGLPKLPGATAVMQPADWQTGAPPGPLGVQPTHPGPEYQLTKAGLHIPKDPGIQNQPMVGSKFQQP
jgi:hypothetical protein